MMKITKHMNSIKRHIKGIKTGAKLEKGDYAGAFEVLRSVLPDFEQGGLYGSVSNSDIIKYMCDICEKRFNREIPYDGMIDNIAEFYIKKGKFDKAYDMITEKDLPISIDYEFYKSWINEFKKFGIDKKKLRKYVDKCLNKVDPMDAFTKPFILLSAADDKEGLNKLATESLEKAREEGDNKQLAAYRTAIMIHDKFGETEIAKDLIKELHDINRFSSQKTIGLLEHQRDYKNIINWIYEKLNEDDGDSTYLRNSLREEELIKEYGKKLWEKSPFMALKYLHKKGVEVPRDKIIEVIDNEKEPFCPRSSFLYEIAAEIGYDEWLNDIGKEVVSKIENGESYPALISYGAKAFMLLNNREGVKKLVKVIKQKDVEKNTGVAIGEIKPEIIYKGFVEGDKKAIGDGFLIHEFKTFSEMNLWGAAETYNYEEELAKIIKEVENEFEISLEKGDKK